jgi:hypothetical protein
VEAETGSAVQKGEVGGVDRSSRGFLGFSQLPGWLNFWVPIVTSLFSFVFALSSLVISTQDPEIVLIMPSRVVVDDADEGADSPFHPSAFYLQPNFVGTGNNGRVELVSQMSLHIEPEGGGPADTLEWSEQGSWTFAEGVNAIQAREYVYAADAAPLLVSPNNAQQPLCVFPNSSSYELRPGVKYVLTLTAERAVAARPIVASVEMMVTKEQIDAYKAGYNIFKYLSVEVNPRRR